MDHIDKKILKLLQQNANLPLSELSKRVGVSTTPCWNRIKKMEELGIISSRITVLNNEKINLAITVFLSNSVKSHQEDWFSQFKNTLMKYDQIIEVYRLASSNTDYLLKIVAPSIEEYDKFQQKLVSEIEFTNMTSDISLKEIKKNYSLPLDFI